MYPAINLLGIALLVSLPSEQSGTWLCPTPMWTKTIHQARIQLNVSYNSSNVLSSGVLVLQLWPLDQQVVSHVVQQLSGQRQVIHSANTLHIHHLYIPQPQELKQVGCETDRDAGAWTIAEN